ncbi:MAG: patatin-like phospholipase family protein [Granulosicoccus sp.]
MLTKSSQHTQIDGVQLLNERRGLTSLKNAKSVNDSAHQSPMYAVTENENRRDGRRILSIDGGGVRCVITMEVLFTLEQKLRKLYGHRTTLSDHFDLVVGTSAGGMLAAGVAAGIPMTDIREFVMKTVKSMFTRSPWYRRHRSLYCKQHLKQGLIDQLGANNTLGSTRLKTGLMLPMRNWTLDSEWLLTNFAGAAPDGDVDDSHLDLHLWELALASAAAPAYYRPEKIVYGRRQPRQYILDDGGMTGSLNPAFRAFLFATRAISGPQWSVGDEQLTIVSLGSGEAPIIRGSCDRKIHVINAILQMPNAMLQASIREQENLCRYFGHVVSDDTVDAVFNIRSEKLFRYHRLNPKLTTPGLAALGFPELSARAVMPMDAGHNLEILSDIGKVYAERQIGPVIDEFCLINALPAASGYTNRN